MQPVRPISLIIAAPTMLESGISPSPALTAIVVIPDNYQTVSRTMDALQNQTAASRMEIVFVVPAAAGVTIPSGLDEHFCRVQIVEISNLLLAPALAEGVRCARAPVVVFTEDHAFPAPNWAERLIAAHEKPFAAVGPAMRNADSTSLVGRADFYMGYGKWAEPIASGTFDFLMEHNSSYKRDVLLAYGPRLDEWLESETVMQFDLAKSGHTFWLEGTTYTAHVCFGQWRPWLACMLWHGRVFANHRSETWSLARRLAYTVTAPLVPFVRLARIRHSVNRANLSLASRTQLFAAIFVGLAAEAAGQGLGYSFGSGNSAVSSLDHEFHRERHLNSIPTAPAE